MLGDDGSDTASYASSDAGVTISLRSGTAAGGDAEGDRLFNIENLAGSAHDDRLTGNHEANTLEGGAGNDRLEGWRGADTLDGGEGDDVLNGGAGNDTLTGGEGNDKFIIVPRAGSDTITDFGTGTDRLQFTGGLFANLEAVQASANETEDGDLRIRLSFTETLTLENTSLDDLTTETVTTLDLLGKDKTTSTAKYYFFFDPDGTPTGAQNSGTEGDDLVEVQGTGNDLIRGLGGDDTLVGDEGDDTLIGGDGDDVFRFGPGAGSDTITDFGTGTDRLEFNDGLFAELYAVRSAATETDGNLEIAISETETLTVDGASLADLTVDTVTTLDAEGTDTTNRASSTGGVLRITGDDVIPGEGEPVTVTASADGLGAVQYQWQRSTDSGFEDIADATGQTYTLGDADTGRTVRVQVSYTDSNGTDETVALVASLPTDNARTEIEEFAAAFPASTFTGTAGDDVLTGSPGDDTFIGGINGAGADRFEGGTGNDSVQYFVRGDTTDLTVNLETGRGEGGTAQGDTYVSVENVATGGGDDTIIGNAANNELKGFYGDDTLRGGAGNDELDDGPGNDTLEGGDGDDVLLNVEGNDSLSGGPGNDVLWAGGSRAALEGVSDNDTLDGGAGNDTVTYERTWV